jgi:hypothetical protein
MIKKQRCIQVFIAETVRLCMPCVSARFVRQHTGHSLRVVEKAIAS